MEFSTQIRARALSTLAAVALIGAAQAQYVQQGVKLVGAGAVGASDQGYALALSADGNTLVVGGPVDYGTGGVGYQGAFWIWSRSGGVWSPQSPKLVGTGAIVNGAAQGSSVAVSADGNTAVVGGPSDNGTIGAAWVWTRTNGVWSQQGNKLVGSGAVGSVATGFSEEGTSVAVSADGNTALVGGPGDNNQLGAVWAWTRTAGTWTQQGSKLVGSGAVGPHVNQGGSIALSADGNTAIIGGSTDNSGTGAAWVWVRSGGVWTQQGNKLVGSGAIGAAFQGVSVALSADGNTAIVGGSSDHGAIGAAWIWTRSGGVWTQASKLVASSGAQASLQGTWVAISGDGSTAVVGAPGDTSGAGAAWIWTRTVNTWTQVQKLVGTDGFSTARQGSRVGISTDASTVALGGPFDNIGAGAV